MVGVASKVSSARIALLKYPTPGATLAVKSRNNPHYCPSTARTSVVGHDIDINGIIKNKIKSLC